MDTFYLKIFAAVIASIFALWGNIPYLRDTINGKVKPHPYTWFIWSIVSLVTFFGVLQKGAGVGAIPTGIAEVFTIFIFLFSIKNGFSNIQKSDNIYLLACVLGLIPWYFTSDPTISVSVVVGIDLIAFIPTLIKTWKYLATENSLLYLMNVLRHILTLSALGNYNYVTIIHSIVMISTNTLMTIFINKKNKQITNRDKY